jgi:hypothetical protein
MSIVMTFFDTKNRHLPAGTRLQLLADGKVLATGVVDETGAASFDADSGGATRLAVRVSPEKPPQGAG